MNSITVTGARETQHTFVAVGLRASNQGTVMQQLARDAQRAIHGVPTDTGRLARSLAGGSDSVLHAGDGGYVIGTTVPYAHFVFGGTRHRRAQPPRVPASLATRQAAILARDLLSAA